MYAVTFLIRWNLCSLGLLRTGTGWAGQQGTRGIFAAMDISQQKLSTSETYLGSFTNSVIVLNCFSLVFRQSVGR